MSKNKSVFLILIAIIIVVFLYSYLTDFRNIKSLVGYNVPRLKKLSKGLEIDFLKISNGFRISIFAKDLFKPRVIAFDSRGNVLISEPQNGRVILLEDRDKDGFAEEKKVLIDNLNLPHGLTFYEDTKSGDTYLYIAETDQVQRYLYDTDKSEIKNFNGQNIANLPNEGRHFSRTIDFGPNFRITPILKGFREKETISKDKLYISVGSSCDTCVESTTWKRAAILESDPIGSFTAEFAGGLRNAVFFTFHPETGQMWATEMGRDNLGDDLPPDEINIIKVADPGDEFGARRYGWPFCYGKQIKDTTFNPEEVKRSDIPQDCSQTEPSLIDIPAHSSPLGLSFISNQIWPQDWQNNLLVAFHGSWNRTVPRGYKVVRYILDSNGNVLRDSKGEPQVEDFITGWLDGKNIFGRPVDLKFGPDSALYISDDALGVIYRVEYDN